MIIHLELSMPIVAWHTVSLLWIVTWIRLLLCCIWYLFIQIWVNLSVPYFLNFCCTRTWFWLTTKIHSKQAGCCFASKWEKLFSRWWCIDTEKIFWWIMQFNSSIFRFWGAFQSYKRGSKCFYSLNQLSELLFINDQLVLDMNIYS